MMVENTGIKCSWIYMKGELFCKDTIKETLKKNTDKIDTIEYAGIGGFLSSECLPECLFWCTCILLNV